MKEEFDFDGKLKQLVMKYLMVKCLIDEDDSPREALGEIYYSACKVISMLNIGIEKVSNPTITREKYSGRVDELLAIFKKSFMDDYDKSDKVLGDIIKNANKTNKEGIDGIINDLMKEE